MLRLNPNVTWKV